MLPLQTLQVRLERRLAATPLEERILVHLYGREPRSSSTSSSRWRPTSGRCSRCAASSTCRRAAVDVAARPDGVRLQRRHGATASAGRRRSRRTPRPPDVDDGDRCASRSPSQPGRATRRSACATRSAAASRSAPAAPGTRRAADGRRRRLAGRAHARPRRRRAVQPRRSSARCSTCGCSARRSTATATTPPGVPWFATLFGRDSLITAIEIARLRPRRWPSRRCACSRERLGTPDDPSHEEEPGKVLHELRVGEVAAPRRHAARALLRHGRRDAAVPLPARASTPTGAATSTLFRELRGAVDATLGWIDRPRRPRRRRPARLPRERAPDGPAQPGLEGLRRRRPRRATARRSSRRSRWSSRRPTRPRQARAGAPVRARRRRGARAGALRGRGRRAARRELERFWLPERGYYAMGLDGDGRAERARSPPTRATCCGPAPSPPERAQARPRRADGRRRCSRAGASGRSGEGEAGLQPGRLPPRHGLAARHRA